MLRVSIWAWPMCHVVGHDGPVPLDLPGATDGIPPDLKFGVMSWYNLDYFSCGYRLSFTNFMHPFEMCPNDGQ